MFFVVMIGLGFMLYGMSCAWNGYSERRRKHRREWNELVIKGIDPDPDSPNSMKRRKEILDDPNSTPEEKAWAIAPDAPFPGGKLPYVPGPKNLIRPPWYERRGTTK